MKTLHKQLLAVSCFLALFAVPMKSQAADIKVGVVNFKSCVEQSKMGKEEQKNFEKMKTQMEEVLQEKEKTLSEIANKFNDPDYLDSLSSEAEAELKHKFRSLNQELNQHQNQYYQALQQANFKIVQKMHDSISDAAKKVAQKKGIDLVLNEEGSFFHNSALDISKDVVVELDRTYG